MNLVALRTSIEKEIDGYVYEVSRKSLGTPLPAEWVAAQLQEMRTALIEPEWVEVAIQDSVEQMRGIAKADLRKCVRVANDKAGYELYYDPTSNDFVLAYSGNPPTTFNVRGDAVGCFMAR